MKKTSTSRSAFFNLRVLIGLFILLAGVSLALLGLGAFSANAAASSAKTQQKQKTATRSIDLSLLPPGFDCSTIHQKGIDKQDNIWSEAAEFSGAIFRGVTRIDNEDRLRVRKEAAETSAHDTRAHPSTASGPAGSSRRRRTRRCLGGVPLRSSLAPRAAGSPDQTASRECPFPS